MNLSASNLWSGRWTRGLWTSGTHSSETTSRVRMWNLVVSLSCLRYYDEPFYSRQYHPKVAAHVFDSDDRFRPLSDGKVKEG
eukprot:755676-Hanusia_phi.AAC.2